MNIIINNKTIETLDGETLLETAKRAGYEIPSLCYAKGAVHKSSCMVCAVKNLTNGQVIPSCTTYPTEDMNIDTDSEEVHNIRTLSLELLLSDHRADCEAPCSMLCPKNMDVELMLNYYDTSRYEKAFALISEAFTLPEIGCDSCKAPCEKACRRGTIDKAVSIRSIIKEVVGMFEQASAYAEKQSSKGNNAEIPNHKVDKDMYLSRLGRFTSIEKERLIATVKTPSRCLHCACAGRSGCKIRIHATNEGIKRPRYEASSTLPAMDKQRITEKLWFEQAKCIRCGLCVYNSKNGFTFKDRGFGMQIVLPEDNIKNIKEELASLCPTGALYIQD